MMNDETTESNDEEDKNRLITLKEAAKIYDFNSVYLAQLANRGRLKAQKVGRDWLTTLRDVEDYIRSRKKTGVYRDDIEIDN